MNGKLRAIVETLLFIAAVVLVWTMVPIQGF
jgi:hypothetical protein